MSGILAKLQYGLSVALVGIGTVFVGLVILIALIKVMEMVIHGATGGKKAPAAAPAPVPAPAPAVVEEEPEQDDDELIAVIAAAVAMAMEAAGEENTTGFVVRSIRRINNAPAWNRAGREEQVYSRM
ncbi:MAG: OadG family protein [Clostridiales bacterium]|nr:OadG family protein [Clostridiales bacterium]